ncbi:hypothetical protein P3T76_012071 [Phytophthora citrophthora]|uniref:Uncharacterized protein n=1 Tax=Phytophthora citrophthora TaxID=4793 RepID=A0AAD9G645_9STRA|nr:hypothetical protein P3T76_012071 [Phytophthora citrophthora]
MNTVTKYHTVPRWFEAAYVLFGEPLRYGSSGFDLLYVPIPNGLTVQEPWVGLGEFWIEPLRCWYKLVVTHCTLANITCALVGMPYRQNHFL